MTGTIETGSESILFTDNETGETTTLFFVRETDEAGEYVVRDESGEESILIDGEDEAELVAMPE